jgi:glycosyltransferase involved in cell wall biosynthesis
MNLRVLMLAPLWYPIGRDAAGGIETFLFQLAGALVGRGCDVTLIASGDSSSAGRLVPAVQRNLYDLMLEGTAGEYVYYEQRQVRLAMKMAPRFDIVHSHIGPGGFLLSTLPGAGECVLHTIHTPVYADMEWFVRTQPHLRLAAVSEFQAAKLRRAGARSCRVVPNGIDVDSFTFNARPTDGLLFLGRIEEGKGPDLAIEVARMLGRPLTLAGPIIDRRFFESRIEPFLGAGGSRAREGRTGGRRTEIRYVGVVDYPNKIRLLGEAACMLLPFRHAESFGMVSLEAMACGTPVVALPNGALPEIVEPGVTGYLAENAGDEGQSSLASLTLRALQLDRAAIRERVASRFGIDRSADGYIELFRQMYTGLPGGI